MYSLKELKVFLIVSIIWLSGMFFYFTNTPHNHRVYDFDGHLQYTEIISGKHKLPSPYDGWETWQPPFYYFLNSFIFPESLKSDKLLHINSVRGLSVLYGVLTIFVIFWFIRKMTANSFIQFLVLLFIATTPMFVVMFSTYNNDSLATPLSLIVLALGYKLYFQWSRKLAFFLFLAASLGLYSKLTVGGAIATLMVICFWSLKKNKEVQGSQKKIIFILLLAIASLLPWALLHNKPYSGKLFPNNSGGLAINLRIDDRPSIDRFLPTTIFKGFETMWKDPWNHPWPNEATKRYSYWSYIFISSVLSVFQFEVPNIGFAWLFLWVHLLVYIIALKGAFKSDFSKLSFAIIILAHLIDIAYLIKDPFSCTMEYRYICWSWIGWAGLYTNSLLTESNFSRSLLGKLFIVAIIAQFYFMLVVRGTGT